MATDLSSQLKSRSASSPAKLGLPVARHGEKYFAPRWRPRQARDAGEAACERLAFPETRHDLHRLIASAELQEGDGLTRPGDTRLLDKPFHLVDGFSSGELERVSSYATGTAYERDFAAIGRPVCVPHGSLHFPGRASRQRHTSQRPAAAPPCH